MFDIVIRNGSVIDGTGRPAFRADVGIIGETIADISPAIDGSARQTIDADGLVISPGFIDMHSHSDFSLLVHPRAESKVRQGVTTEAVGNCGGSPGPVPVERFDDFMQYMVGLGRLYKKNMPDTAWQWDTLADFYRQLAAQGIGLNVAPLVGHGTLRCHVMGYADRTPATDEMNRMKALLTREMAKGAFGLSSGLIYHPGAFAESDELAQLAGVVKAFDGIYTTHMRSEGKFLFKALDEAIGVAERSGVSLQISHLKCETPPMWGKAGQMLARIDQARSQGLSVEFDQYPYPAYYTGLIELFPTWAKDGGADRTIAALTDDALRQRVTHDMTHPPADWDNPMEGLGWDQIRLLGFSLEKYRPLDGLTVEQIAAKLDLDPLNSVFKVFCDEKGTLGMIVFSMSEADLAVIMQHPAGMIGSDGCAVAPYGPSGASVVHPRYYGTFPRVLGRYVRERKIISLVQAVHRMTGRPAAKLKLSDRGLVIKGRKADIVAFDAEQVADTATFERPHRYPEGIHHVLVNGQPVIAEGEHTGRLPGRVLSRSA